MAGQSGVTWFQVHWFGRCLVGVALLLEPDRAAVVELFPRSRRGTGVTHRTRSTLRRPSTGRATMTCRSPPKRWTPRSEFHAGLVGADRPVDREFGERTARVVHTQVRQGEPPEVDHGCVRDADDRLVAAERGQGVRGQRQTVSRFMGRSLPAGRGRLCICCEQPPPRRQPGGRRAEPVQALSGGSRGTSGPTGEPSWASGGSAVPPGRSFPTVPPPFPDRSGAPVVRST